MSVNIKFDLNAPVQTNFLGNNVVYHGYAGMPDNAGRVYSDELCNIEADRAAELGVRITRTFYKWYSWIPETQTWDWETPECKSFYKWLQRMIFGGLYFFMFLKFNLFTTCKSLQ